MTTPHIVILGGGYVGMYTALRLQQAAARDGEARVTVIDPRSLHDLPAVPARGGRRQPRAPACRRAAAPGADKVPNVITGRVAGVDHARKVVTVQPSTGPSYELRVRHRRRRARLDGAHAADPRPGRAGHRLQDRSKRRSRCATACSTGWTSAESTRDASARRARSTSSFVGGGYAGRRGAGRARGHGQVRHPLLRNIEPARLALGARRGDRPDPARGR